jgi:hypothetical protein
MTWWDKLPSHQTAAVIVGIGEERSILMDIDVLGIDLGKTVCSIAGLDATGAVVFRKRLQRHRLLGFLEDLRPCVMAIEACGGAHHIGGYCLQDCS